MTVPLIDTAALSDYIGSDATGDQGDFACLAASRAIIDYLDNEIVLDLSVTERIDGSGTDALVLPKPPVRLITSVTECGVDLVEGADFFMRSAMEGILYRGSGYYPGPGGTWPIGRGNITVVYDRGYDLIPGGPYETPSDMPLPEDITLVALAMAKRILASGALPVGGFRSETMGAYSYTLDDTAAASGVFALQEGESRILARYRDRGAV